MENGLVELRFDLPGESVNKLGAVALASLKAAVGDLTSRKGLRGVLLTSGKDVFCVGADITEFLAHFKRSEAELTTWTSAPMRSLGSRRPGHLRWSRSTGSAWAAASSWP